MFPVTQRLALIVLVFVLAVVPSRPLSAQEVDGVTLVKASLIASTTTVVPGQPFDVGVLMEMAPDWHTYWENSGDAGLPTTIKWQLPEGWQAGPIQWPLPESKVEPGEINTYGYAGRVLLVTTITPPTEARGEVLLRAKVAWLVCKELCIPGSKEVELRLPVGKVVAPDHTEVFQEFQSQLPSVSPPPYRLEWGRTGDLLELQITGLPATARTQFFPLPTENQTVGHPISLAPDRIQIKVQGDLRGVLSVEDAATSQSWFVQSKDVVPAALPVPNTGLWLALLYGFIGGLILNLMPCVLPVISLKIFGFIKQSGDEPRKILAHGIAFVVGIFTWFLGLGLLIVALKAGGSEVTWAFQFQNAWFNVVIGSVVFVFALNLFGVFEVVLPGKAAQAIDTASSSTGLGGSFFQGVFATLLATPCTAPFLGTALGFAFSQSAFVIMGMFAAIAAGMGSPYLLLSAKPGWLRYFPKPGAWMERLKHFMAFPLLATLVWILSILGAQRGAEGIVWFAGFLLCLAFACWLYGAYVGPLTRPLVRWTAIALALAVAAGGGYFFLGKQFSQIGIVNSEGIAWVPFSQAALDAEQAAGRSVFLDFTADWCITCKFNERTAIDTPAVRTLFAERGVVPMKADWTNANPEITATLKSFGRVGVPFYVIYSPGIAPVVLPELLTEGILLEALKKIP